MYSSTEDAFAALDFSGLGYVTEEALLGSILVKERMPFPEEQIKTFFREYNLFNVDSPGMNFDSFKKNFFPQFYLV